jgi:cell division septal protein FtsQ
MARRSSKSLTSTHPVRPLRRRVMVGVCLTAVLGVMVTAILAGREALNRAPGYSLIALEVHGLRLLSGEEVLAASRLQPQDSIFHADLDEVASRISQLVWVRSARVERRPPDRLVVTLQERRRTAWLDWHGELFGLDEDGVVLPRGRLTTEGVTDLDLPVIRPHEIFQVIDVDTTATVWEPVVGETVPQGHQVQTLLTWWLQAGESAPELISEVSEILPLDTESLRLRLVADDLEIRLPLHDADCLQALLAVLARVYHDVPDAVYVDMRFQGQAVVGTTRTVVERGEPRAQGLQVFSHG